MKVYGLDIGALVVGRPAQDQSFALLLPVNLRFKPTKSFSSHAEAWATVSALAKWIGKEFPEGTDFFGKIGDISKDGRGALGP